MATKNTSLDDLPEHILVHILSFLPTTRDAYRTSFISRKWRNLWISIPSFNLSVFVFKKSNLETLESFAKFIDKTLSLRDPQISICNFCLDFNFINRQFTFQLSSWIQYAISRNAKKLKLCLLTDNNEDRVRYEFPFSVLGDSQVEVLDLFYCKLSILSNMWRTTRSFSLRSVSLDKVVLTDQMVVDLMAVCVNLEELGLSSVVGCKDIKICSSKLRKLSMYKFKCKEGSVEIVAPNLKCLSIAWIHVGNYALIDGSSLVEARVSDSYFLYGPKVMSLLGNVKHLRLHDWCFELLRNRDLSPHSFALPNLISVTLWTDYTKSNLIGIALLLANSPNLQSMILEYPNTWPLDKMFEKSTKTFIMGLNFKMPRLRYVEMKSFTQSVSETNFLSVLLYKGMALERVVLNYAPQMKVRFHVIVIVKSPHGIQLFQGR